MARLLTCAPPLLAPAVNSPPSQCFRLQKKILKYFIYMKMNLTNVAEKKVVLSSLVPL